MLGCRSSNSINEENVSNLEESLLNGNWPVNIRIVNHASNNIRIAIDAFVHSLAFDLRMVAKVIYSSAP